MLCSECKKRLATVHLKALSGGRLIDRHLCGECAHKAGLELMGPSPLLAGLLAALAAGSAVRRPSPCPSCSLTWSQFQKSGRLGCARCYEHFAAPLSRVLAKVHGAEAHAGKRPSVDSAGGPETADSIRARLRAAVEREDYETAARLHARLKKLGQALPMRQLHNLLKFKTAWAQAPGAERPVVLASRVRLARNLADRPFPGHAAPKQLKDARRLVFEAVRDAGVLANPAFLQIEDLEPVDRALLVERHLISPDLAAKPDGRGLAVGDGEAAGVMVNEEDHLRIQVLAPGLKLQEVFQQADAIESALSRHAPFAHHPQWGYLAACPTNTGTGLRASALVHLGALAFLGKVESLLKEATRHGFVVRGLYGEGTRVLGDVFQISTGNAMGRAEVHYVGDLARFLRWVTMLELRHQDGLKEGAWRTRVEDQVFRALGTLLYARALTYEELMEQLSLVRLGLSLGIRLGPGFGAVQELFLTALPAHLQYAQGRELGEAEDLSARAELARQTLGA